jgi:hypothetical protein
MSPPRNSLPSSRAPRLTLKRATGTVKLTIKQEMQGNVPVHHTEQKRQVGAIGARLWGPNRMNDMADIARIERARPVVINLGLPKSGTTTLAFALRAGGYRVADWRLRADDGKQGAYVGLLMHRGMRASGNPLQYLSNYDAFTQIDALVGRLNVWPQLDPNMLDAIEAHNPGVKFVLSRRDPYEQADSMRRWTDLGKVRLPRAAIKGLPRGRGQTQAELATWISGHYAMLNERFEGRDNFFSYEMDDPQACHQIAEFLGTHLPWWGVANANPPGRAQPLSGYLAAGQ